MEQANCPKCGGQMSYSPALQVPVCDLCHHALNPKDSVLTGLGAGPRTGKEEQSERRRS